MFINSMLLNSLCCQYLDTEPSNSVFDQGAPQLTESYLDSKKVRKKNTNIAKVSTSVSSQVSSVFWISMFTGSGH